ncbi:hypothetical protein QBC47DRAFT_404976 [Echria macrotheca]|uniref:Uncharacterized protein n=1 Tax=Echria macrotheca TaxID=438768 RepID=A0AAJ0F6S2_9PEZI|nr:hypothetical protein QBC47DRAFT_404976 [Echria macrotheca]
MRSSMLQNTRKVLHQILGQEGEFPAYFSFYNDLTHRHNDYHVTIDAPPTLLPITGDTILLAANTIRSNVSRSKKETDESFRTLAASDPKACYNEKAVRIATQAMFMVDPNAEECHATDFTLGAYRPLSWRSDETLVAFIHRVFPPSLTTSQEVARDAVEYRSLRARKLQKRLGARFRPTNDMAQHLLFDEKRNCLYLFHHVGFLKAHLSRYRAKEKPLAVGLEGSLAVGTLPPQLLVETLYTLQAVLFPSIDPDSAQTLDELIEKRGFDPECAEYEGYELFQDLPSDFRFVYWGERIAHLHQLMSRSPPRNKLERWFRRKSTEGNALFVALLALVISILVGLVSIVLSCVQIWITWYTWKYTP